jgi:hypothetical protein
MDKNIDFLMRASSKSLSEINNSKFGDQEINILITRDRKRELQKNGIEVETNQLIKIRVIKFKLESGKDETLITNLLQNELNFEEAKDLYFQRWSIETKFDTLKNRLQIENFSGDSPLTIEQDFYASILVSNLAALFKQDAQEELDEKNKNKKLKHDYSINNNILIGKLKIKLILILLEDDPDKQMRMYNNFVKKLEQNVIPIRKDRLFERKKLYPSNKYPKNKRRAL